MEINSVDTEESSNAKNFYYWKDLYPELSILYNNRSIIEEECSKINSVSLWWVLLTSNLKYSLISGYLGLKTTFL